MSRSRVGGDFFVEHGGDAAQVQFDGVFGDEEVDAVQVFLEAGLGEEAFVDGVGKGVIPPVAPCYLACVSFVESGGAFPSQDGIEDADPVQQFGLGLGGLNHAYRLPPPSVDYVRGVFVIGEAAEGAEPYLDSVFGVEGVGLRPFQENLVEERPLFRPGLG